jgi:DNA-nicking Smr family endonuclease
VFADAMAGVARIRWRHGPVPSEAIPVPPGCPDPEVLDERLFHEAVEGDAALPILEHPEYIEGWIGVTGQRFLPQLRAGVYSIQGAIDLHGLGRTEAREAVEAFILRMSGERSCCVKIVHGRGINSPSDKAVLKEHLQRWLATRRMSRCVVAYASAPHTDGGVGAIYVLLRRRGTGG